MDANLHTKPWACLSGQGYHGRQRVGARKHRNGVSPVVRAPDGGGSGIRAVGRVPKAGLCDRGAHALTV
eukprot:4253511-Lingulodinium_polyedra.AAC.1